MLSDESEIKKIDAGQTSGRYKKGASANIFLDFFFICSVACIFPQQANTGNVF